MWYTSMLSNRFYVKASNQPWISVGPPNFEPMVKPCKRIKIVMKPKAKPLPLVMLILNMNIIDPCCKEALPAKAPAHPCLYSLWFN
jgi:hypothetical protein